MAFEPEDESPIVLLRLRKAARAGTRVLAVAPAASRGLAKTQGTWIPATPGSEASVVDGLDAETVDALSQHGAVILVGERAAATPGLLSAVGRLAARTGAALGWVPRRAGDRGAVEAGLLPSLLPGGRPVGGRRRSRRHRSDLGRRSRCPRLPVATLPTCSPAIESRELSALVVGGRPARRPAGGAEAALRATEFLVVLDTHAHELVELADVVFPVAVAPEKSGTFVNWEGRERPSSRALRTNLMSDARVLAAIAAELGVDLHADQETLLAQLAEFAGWEGARIEAPDVRPAAPRAWLGPGAGDLASAAGADGAPRG